MASEFTVIANGKADKRKYVVPAIAAPICGIWDEERADIIAPCTYSLRALLPYRYRKAFDRAGKFWFDKAARWNGQRVTCGNLPRIALHDARGRYLFTLYAIPRNNLLESAS